MALLVWTCGMHEELQRVEALMIDIPGDLV